MQRVQLVHWKAEEAPERLQRLREAGFQPLYEPDPPSLLRSLKSSPPAAVVIDLSRLPSHGREVGTGIRGNKTTRLLPLIFVGGAPDKVTAIRAVLPDAVYCDWDRIGDAIRKAIASPPQAPVVPTQMMDRYAGRSLAQKLGVPSSARVAVVDPPGDYTAVLAGLPPETEYAEDPADICPVTLWFIRDPAALGCAIERMRRLASRTKLWVLWPKQKKGKIATGIREQDIRDTCLAADLVDYKVCSVNDSWSAIAVTKRRTSESRRS